MKCRHNFGRHLGRNVVAALVVAAGLVGMRIAEAQAAPKAQVAPEVVGKLLQVGGTRFVVKGAAAYILPFYNSADGSKEFAQDYTYSAYVRGQRCRLCPNEINRHQQRAPAGGLKHLRGSRSL